MTKFRCVGCGSCCKRVKNLPNFPQELIKEDGSCKNLLPDGSCSTYEDRPELCRVQEYHENMIAKTHPDISLYDWYYMNYASCLTMIEEDYGKDHKYGEKIAIEMSIIDLAQNP